MFMFLIIYLSKKQQALRQKCSIYIIKKHYYITFNHRFNKTDLITYFIMSSRIDILILHRERVYIIFEHRQMNSHEYLG
jgi:hypothetical protein